jgi:predicted Ser/Thr protein kinase
MDNIFEQFPTREAFDEYWKENYVPLTYEDVKQEYEEFVKSADKHIFLSDYEESGSVSRDTFMENLSQDAAFTFQDTLTEVFYDKNPDLYETAFAIYEEAQMSGTPDKDTAQTFHEEYNRLYREFLLTMYDAMYL